MRKTILALAASSAFLSAPAMANEIRVEGRAGVIWASGQNDLTVGLAAGYDFDMSDTSFVGGEVSIDSDVEGSELVQISARSGAKVGDGKAYVLAAYEINQANDFAIGAGYQHNFNDNRYGKLEYRRFLTSGTDVNAAVFGFGMRF